MLTLRITWANCCFYFSPLSITAPTSTTYSQQLLSGSTARKGAGGGFELYLLEQEVNYIIFRNSVQETCLFSPTCLFSHLFIWIPICLLLLFNFRLKSNINVIYFAAPVAPVLAIGIFFRLAPVVVWHAPTFFFFFNISLLSCPMRHSRFILCISCPYAD